MTKTHRITALIAAALILSWAQPPRPSGPLNILGLSIWIFALRGLSPIQAFFAGGLCGTVFGYFNASWASDALIGFGARPRVALLATLAGAAYVKGVEMAVESAGMRWLSPRYPLLRCLHGGVVVFLVETWISSSAWSVPWGLVGHAHVDNPGVSQLAVVAGVPLVSAVATMLASAISLAWTSARPKEAGLAVVATVVGWTVLSLAGQPTARTIRSHGSGPIDLPRFVLAIQPSIPRSDRWMPSRQRENLARVLAQTQAAIAAVKKPPELVIWPELIVTSPLDIDLDLSDRVLGAAKILRTPILTGVSYTASGGTMDAGGYRNVAILIDSGGRIQDTIEKSLAVPLIEAAEPAWPISIFAQWLSDDLRTSVAVTQGPVGHELVGDLRVATLLCYEALFPRFAALRRSQSTDFITVLADNSWLSDKRPGEQLAAYSRYRSIEQRLALLRIAHTGVSLLADEYGTVIGQISPSEPSYLVFPVSHSRPAAVMEKTAIFLLYICPTIMVFVVNRAVSNTRRRFIQNC